MGNPRKRKAIKDGRMQQMIEQEKAANRQPEQPVSVEKEKLLFDEPIVASETKEKAGVAMYARRFQLVDA